MTEKPETPPKKVDLTEYAQQWYEVRVLKAAADAATLAYETRRDKLKGFIGDADEVIIHGQVVATHPRGAFNRAKFVKENPTLASQYMTRVSREEFDEERFASENPGLWLAYKIRSLRAKDGQ